MLREQRLANPYMGSLILLLLCVSLRYTQSMKSEIAPVEVSDTFGRLSITGNDAYRLHGRPRVAPHRRLPLRNHTLSEEEEREFLFHEEYRAPLSNCDGPMPWSNDAAYDRGVKQRLDAPRWCRAYRVEGAISVSGKRGFVYLNGRLFKPSTAEKIPPYHTTFRRIVEEYRKRTRKRIELDEVLLVRHVWDHIYFHTYNDLLTKIAWADELGISKDIPIVVSSKWARGNFGSHFVNSNLLNDRKNIFQEPDQTLVCDRLYWLRTPQFWQPYLRRVANSFAEQKPSFDVSDRLVLIREKKTHDKRLCEGMDAFSQQLEREGFTCLDSAALTISEQKWVFARARHIVGENGSAFTNMVHRQEGNLMIDSLMHSRRTTSTFPAMAKALGITLRNHILHSTRDQTASNAVLDEVTRTRIMDQI